MCFDSSSSSSSNSTQTTNVDKRQVVDGNGVGVTSDSSTVNVNTTMTDLGAIQGALKSLDSGNALNGQNFDSVLTLADKLFTGGFDLMNKSAANVSAAYATQQSQAGGSFDNKTIAIIAVAGAAAWALKGRL